MPAPFFLPFPVQKNRLKDYKESYAKPLSQLLYSGRNGDCLPETEYSLLFQPETSAHPPG